LTRQAEFPEVVSVCRSNQEVLDACDWVFLCTAPGNDALKKVYSEVNFQKEHVVVCLVAGTATAVIKEVVAPATRVVQAFPLPPAEVHKSTTPMCPQDDDVEALFNQVGKLMTL